jgi:hypothetical protein
MYIFSETEVWSILIIEGIKLKNVMFIEDLKPILMFLFSKTTAGEKES